MIPTGDFLAHVGDWTGISHAELLGLMRGAAPVSAGGSDELERLDAAIGEGPGRAGAARSHEDDPAPRARRTAGAPGRRGIGGVRLSRSGRVPTARRFRHLASRPRSSCPTRCCARSASPCEGRDLDTADVDDRIARRAQPGPRGAPRRVRRAARRGPAALPAPRRARHLQRHLGVGADAARPCSPAVAGSRAGGASTSPSTSSTRASTRCARCSTDADGTLGRRARGALRSTAAATPPRTRRRSSATRRSRRPTRPACRRPSARLMRATGIAMGSLFGSSEAEHEEHVLRGLAASPGVYEGPARRVSGPDGVRADRPGRRAVDRGDDRGVQHLAAAARRDRDRQRRPALALGDRRARVRHPGCRRHARGDRPHRRRHARARRRRPPAKSRSSA